MSACVQTTASKSSLLDEDSYTGGAAGGGGPGAHNDHDSISAIYSIIRDYAATNQLQQVPYPTAEAMVLMKGFSAQQLNMSLTEYTHLHVISLDEDRTCITFFD